MYEAEPDLAKRNDYAVVPLFADYFIGSVQAIAETGEIFVASATGKSTRPVCLCCQARHFSGGYPENRAHI